MLKRTVLLIVFFTLLSIKPLHGQTHFTHIMDAPIPNGSNVFYCAGLEFLWNEIRSQFSTPAKESCALTSRLDAQMGNEYQAPLDGSSYFTAFTISSEQELRRIQKSIKEQFGFDWRAPGDLTNSDLLALSFLKHRIDFQETMPETFEQNLFNKKENVDYFGYDFARKKFDRKEVLVHDYRDKDNFIIQIRGKDSLDELFLAKVPPQASLLETYESVSARIGVNTEYLSSHDVLSIPYLKIDTSYAIPDLLCLNTFAESNPLHIKSASQCVSFELNESGVRFQALTESIIEFGIIEGVQPRYLSINKSFLLIMKRGNKAKPYVVAWIANADLMRNYRLPERSLEAHETFLVGTWDVELSGAIVQGRRYHFYANGKYDLFYNGQLSSDGLWKIQDGILELETISRFDHLRSTKYFTVTPISQDVIQIDYGKFIRVTE